MNGSEWPAAASVLTRLWPDVATRPSRRPGTASALLVLPTARSPRIMVPSRCPGASVMLRRHAPTARRRAVQAVLAAGQRSGALRLLPVPRLVLDGAAAGLDSVSALVREQVPGGVHVGVLLGPPRANAKPVLQVFDARGATVGFGKVGHDERAAALVTRETEVLRHLAERRTPGIEVPRVLWSGRWHGLQVLLMSPLEAAQRHAGSWSLPLPAMRTVAEVDGLTHGTLDDSDHVAALLSRQAGLAGAHAGLSARLAGTVRAVGGTRLAFGRWHGDWAPWNSAVRGAVLQVWDWERSVPGVPVGFDVAHFLLQRLLRDAAARPGAVPTGAAAELLRGTTAALSGWYGPGADRQAAVTVLLYLVEIRTRYLSDSAGRPAARLRRRLDVVESIGVAVSDHVTRGSSADA